MAYGQGSQVLTTARPSESIKIGLVEEFLLLTLEDDGGQFARVPETSLSCGLAGAALIDLEIRGKIETDYQGLWVVDSAPTGSPMLDKVLATVAAEAARLHPRDWITRLMPEALNLRREALRTLCERGILAQEEHLFLWVLKERRYPVEHGEERMECKRRVLELLFNEERPGHHDAALVALADATGMFHHILKKDTLYEATPRIGQLRGLDLIGAAIARTAEEKTKEIRAAERRIVMAGLAGNVMEWYDFGTYGYFAAVLGKLFFPAHDATVSLLASFAVFAVGFIGRPLGALIFGHIGDRQGRKRALMASVVMMAVPTMLIGLLPTYAQIGIAAPALLVVLRLGQGLAVGGEFTTSIILLVEGAQRSRRAYIGSFAPFGAIGGMLIGSAVGAAISELPADTIAAWGWRAAFLFGLVIAGVVMYVRRRLPPDPHIVAIAEARHAPVVEAFKTQWRTILKVVGMLLTLGLGFYLNFVYIATWLTQYAHVSHAEALALNCLGLAIQLPLLPLAGALADKIGSKALLLIAALGFVLLSWPVYVIIVQGTVIAILFGQAILAVLQAGISGGNSSFMVEVLPKHVRCTALSFGQNLTMACFGGTVPMVAVALIKWTGYPLAPSIYLAVAGLVTFAVVLVTNALPEEAERLR